MGGRRTDSELILAITITMLAIAGFLGIAGAMGKNVNMIYFSIAICILLAILGIFQSIGII